MDDEQWGSGGTTVGTMKDDSSPTLLTIASVDDLFGAVPALLHFHPSESLVLVHYFISSLRDPVPHSLSEFFSAQFMTIRALIR